MRRILIKGGVAVYLLMIAIVVFTSCNTTKKDSESSSIEKPAITPKWAFGHIVWEDSINTQDAALSLVAQYKENKIPVGGVIIDSPWSLSYNDFNWDTEKYPNPQEMINTFKAEDVKVILWLTGCINNSSRDVPVQKSPYFDYAIEHNYVVNNGKTSKWWKGEGLHLDFTNPEAVKWWNSLLDKVFVDGVYGWKVDQGEYYFADSLSMLHGTLGQDDTYFGDTVTTSIGRISMREFKRYYYNSMFDYARSKNSEAITIARPFSHQGDFAASINKLGVGWSGDFKGNYEGLKLQISNIYTSAKAGYGALACEVGGFYEDRSTKNQLIRYAQFGSMTASMVNGGQNGAFTNHLAWYHDKETTDIYRYYTTLHYQLSQYMFSTVVDAHISGGSLIKDVSFEQESHKVGNDIFFKAITSDTNKVTFTLPAGDEWIDFWTNEKYQGGEEITKEYELSKAPIFVRAGAIIPFEIENDVTGIGNDSFAGKTVIIIYPKGESNYVFHKPVGDGIEYKDINISYSNGVITVNAEQEYDFVFLVKGSTKEPANVKGSDSWKYSSKKKCVKIEKTGLRFSMEIL
jgi:alpha-glucosidase (family GH31 glycosyl hydrolase)